MFSGYRTYTVAALTAVYAVVGYYLDFHDFSTMVALLSTAAGMAGLRHGITTETNK